MSQQSNLAKFKCVIAAGRRGGIKTMEIQADPADPWPRTMRSVANYLAGSKDPDLAGESELRVYLTRETQEK